MIQDIMKFEAMPFKTYLKNLEMFVMEKQRLRAIIKCLIDSEKQLTYDLLVIVILI